MKTKHVLLFAVGSIFALGAVIACNDQPAKDPSVEVKNPPSVNATTDIPSPQVNSSDIKAPQANGPSVNVGSQPGHDMSGKPTDSMKTDGGK